MTTIDKRPINTDWVRVENLAQFMTKVPYLNPDDPEYLKYWSVQTKRCIEGKWGKMFGKYRYMRPNLYYYANFCLIQQTDANKITKYIKPSITDLEWEISYGLMTARGFSGFIDDDEITCLNALKEMRDEGLAEDIIIRELSLDHPEIIDSKGKLKKYRDPLEHCRDLHDKKLGRALYKNRTQNFMIFGSRGGGKSYIVGIGEVEHGLMFDGATHFNDDFVEEIITAEFCIGASDAEKSSELCSKIKASIEAKADVTLGRQFGVYKDEHVRDQKGRPRIVPCPFFRHMSGSIGVSNKETPYIYSYKNLDSGKLEGTLTKLNHVNYSTSKAQGSGDTAASGGRYLVSAIEEAGLVDNIINVHNSNESTVSREGVRFGSEIYLGTSGNMKTVHGAKKMFLNPKDYKILSYPNKYGNEGAGKQIGFFLPFYMTLRQYKDKDGNTDFEKAAAYVNKVREACRKSTDPSILKGEKMNRPCFVEEMWLTADGDIMPTAELQLRHEELMKNNLYQTIGTPIKLHWDSTHPQGVNYVVDHEGEPFTDWPLDYSKRKVPQGCPMMYHPPIIVDGKIPNDLYCFIGHDPYIQEDITKGGSVGVTYILANPKYIPLGYHGNVIVASYIDKPIQGLNYYYETQEKLMALYGNPNQGLWYEANRGQDCRAHYIGKNKANLLALTPQFTQGNNVFQKNITSYGYFTGNRDNIVSMSRWMRDWLLEETSFPDKTGFLQDDNKRNVERIPCIFLIKQLLDYNFDDNFDAVDGFRGCIVGLRNAQIRERSETLRQTENSVRMSGYLNNPKIFKNAANKPTRGLFTS
jgi:hypothetical protein